MISPADIEKGSSAELDAAVGTAKEVVDIPLPASLSTSGTAECKSETEARDETQAAEVETLDSAREEVVEEESSPVEVPDAIKSVTDEAVQPSMVSSSNAYVSTNSVNLVSPEAEAALPLAQDLPNLETAAQDTTLPLARSGSSVKSNKTAKSSKSSKSAAEDMAVPLTRLLQKKKKKKKPSKKLSRKRNKSRQGKKSKSKQGTSSDKPAALPVIAEEAESKDVEVEIEEDGVSGIPSVTEDASVTELSVKPSSSVGKEEETVVEETKPVEKTSFSPAHFSCGVGTDAVNNNVFEGLSVAPSDAAVEVTTGFEEYMETKEEGDMEKNEVTDMPIKASSSGDKEEPGSRSSPTPVIPVPVEPIKASSSGDKEEPGSHRSSPVSVAPVPVEPSTRADDLPSDLESMSLDLATTSYNSVDGQLEAKLDSYKKKYGLIQKFGNSLDQLKKKKGKISLMAKSSKSAKSVAEDMAVPLTRSGSSVKSNKSAKSSKSSKSVVEDMAVSLTRSGSSVKSNKSAKSSKSSKSVAEDMVVEDQSAEKSIFDDHSVQVTEVTTDPFTSETEALEDKSAANSQVFPCSQQSSAVWKTLNGLFKNPTKAKEVVIELLADFGDSFETQSDNGTFLSSDVESMSVDLATMSSTLTEDKSVVGQLDAKLDLYNTLIPKFGNSLDQLKKKKAEVKAKEAEIKEKELEIEKCTKVRKLKKKKTKLAVLESELAGLKIEEEAIKRHVTRLHDLLNAV